MAGLQGTTIANIKSALADARTLLAINPAAAEKQARVLLAADIGNPPVLRLLGAALRCQGKTIAAATAEHQALEASMRDAGHRAVGQAIQAGDLKRAQALLWGLVRDDESDVLALMTLGRQAAHAGEFAAAEPLLRRAVALAPEEPATRMALAELLHWVSRPALALAEIDAMNPATARVEAVQSLRADILTALGRLEEALEVLQGLTSPAEQNFAYYGLRIGHALRSLGRQDEAIAAYRAIIDLHPGEGAAWWSLANLKTVRFDDADIATMAARLAKADMPVVNRICLNFALGKAYEDRRDAEIAYGHYSTGNRLCQSISNYDPLIISQWVDKSIALFTPAFFAARANQGSLAPDPIFIIGMQRSGSTLVEQILASHSAIEGTAELTIIPNIVLQLRAAAACANKSFERYFLAVSPGQLRTLGQSYVEASRVHRSTDRPFFTDKMPDNWRYLGLIRAILPNVRIVDVRRDPMSCCFSNWKQLYAHGRDHSNTLEAMGGLYANYVRLMRHFDAAQPGMIHRIIYDDLVNDLEGEVRRLLDYLDLPFDPSCLDFHANDRAVRTISAGQVRKPINREGIGQWQMFEQWLGPLKAALGDTLDQWRD